MTHHTEQHAGIPVLTFQGQGSADTEDGSEFLKQIAVAFAWVASFLVIAIWLGLWAINKPVYPTACDQQRSECAAAVEAR